MEQQAQTQEKPILGNGIFHPSARPMQFIVDKTGCIWVCDKPVDPEKPLKEQFCWKCSDMAFTRND
jgi:hypothetical protein